MNCVDVDQQSYRSIFPDIASYCREGEHSLYLPRGEGENFQLASWGLGHGREEGLRKQLRRKGTRRILKNYSSEMMVVEKNARTVQRILGEHAIFFPPPNNRCFSCRIPVTNHTLGNRVGLPPFL